MRSIVITILYTLLLTISQSVCGQSAEKNIHLRVINIDFTREKGALNKMFNECVGAGRANEGLRAIRQGRKLKNQPVPFRD